MHILAIQMRNPPEIGIEAPEIGIDIQFAYKFDSPERGGLTLDMHKA